MSNENEEVTTKRALSRRILLRGAGVAMTLPWLESAAVWGAPLASKQTTPTPPKRFVVQFMGTGISPNNWGAKGEGAQMELGKCLAPLEPFKTKLNVISGLFNKPSTGVGIHPGMTGGILSGAALTRGAVLHGGVSMDQVLAQRLGQDTVQPSIVLSCEKPLTGYHESNFSMAYSSYISWQDADSPVPSEVYPSLAFDGLFDNSGSQRLESVLDRVGSEAASLRRKISREDRGKLDEYLNSVREVEKRAQKLRTEMSKAADNARGKGKPLVAMKRPDDGLPEDLREHMRLMCDIVALAIQTDKTRIASMLMCRDLSGLFYPFLNVNDGHHIASHSDNSEGYQRIVHHYVTQLAYLAGKLDAMPEGPGTVLDNTCILWLSNMYSGSNHDNTHLPILTVGGMGGALATGRVLNYRDKGDGNRKVCSLYLSLMDRMGVKLDRFGDADTRLAGI
ncbi:DUF1552 domain-containing protein [Armatimonas sp.]|uniref:DUF1552 domain-containing protein n=1 Tax=Armatimonas sp. TaxID=1872638 RepID=UPI00374CE020